MSAPTLLHMGQFEGVNKFGQSTNVDGAATDIWNRANITDDQKIWLAPTAARIHTLVSTSASDDGDPAGVGAQIVRVYGLPTWTTEEAFEDVTMDGITGVAMTQSMVIIHRMQVIATGASGPNVGTITATAATDATVTAQIQPLEGQTQMAIYGIPSGMTFHMTSYAVSMNKSTAANARVSCSLLYCPFPDVQPAVFLLKEPLAILDGGTSYIQRTYNPFKRFLGPGIIKIQALSSVADSDISAAFDGVSSSG